MCNLGMNVVMALVMRQAQVTMSRQDWWHWPWPCKRSRDEAIVGRNRTLESFLVMHLPAKTGCTLI